MDYFEKTFIIHSRDVTRHRELRLSNMLGFFQEASISHTEALGVGRDKTLDKGLLWIIARQSAEIIRMPRYDEKVTFRSWPGPTMRVFFPRYYEVSSGGETIVRGCAMWMLIDEETRNFIFPDEYGIEIKGFFTGNEIPEPRSLAIWFKNTDDLRLVSESLYTARFSHIDINGHVNNCRYFDVVEDMIPTEEYIGYDNTLIEAEYLTEVRPGDTITVKAYRTDDARLFEGVTDRSCFRIRMKQI